MSLDEDSIHVEKLQLPHGVTAPDIWGQTKQQPATVSVALFLKGEGFHTAANKDELDQSTVHYGELAKRIRAANAAGQDVEDFVTAVQHCVETMATKANNNFILERVAIILLLPKATKYGKDVTMHYVIGYEDSGKIDRFIRYHEINEIKVMTLVGVNGYERKAEQPLEVDLVLLRWVEKEKGIFWPSMQSLAGLEEKAVEIIRATSFETLETLADHTAKQLQEQLLEKLFPDGCMLRLKISKPRAIAFADAPAVEVSRNTIKDARKCPPGGCEEPAGNVEDLKVVKPYA